MILVIGETGKKPVVGLADIEDEQEGDLLDPVGELLDEQRDASFV